MSIRACHACLLVLEIPAGGMPPSGTRLGEWRCPRCGTGLPSPGTCRNRLNRVWALALTAVILLVPGVFLPALTIDKLGHHTQTGILSGCLHLWNARDHLLAIVIFFCSIVIPFVKLGFILVLTTWSHRFSRSVQVRGLQIVERIGRWGMLDVLVIAVLIACIKAGQLVSISSGPGTVFFALGVLFNLLAGMQFEPWLIWEEEASA